ncbi:hypothetical protein [Amantichitinum ursilacus]|uniref:Uncharacterized protein n=1 Tax=Amantichitinum ursilacus TaxID=857265 RepID=A0A0N0GRC3_9NEIS|nr:hypothetical protein [Amantichitinum ursilacus]KPC55299.1 hypothetical protein WG78_01540 [Amantichitinum ursilacus]
MALVLAWAGMNQPAQRSRWIGALATIVFNAAVIALLLSIRQRAPLLQSAQGVMVRLLPAERSAAQIKPQPAIHAELPATRVEKPSRLHARPRSNTVVAPPGALPAPTPDSPPDIAISQSLSAPDVAPSLNLDALRDHVRKTLRRADASAPSIPDLGPPRKEPQTALAREMAKAIRPSCGSAHADLMLLAPLAIAKDVITGTGCTLQP